MKQFLLFIIFSPCLAVFQEFWNDTTWTVDVQNSQLSVIYGYKARADLLRFYDYYVSEGRDTLVFCACVRREYHGPTFFETKNFLVLDCCKTDDVGEIIVIEKKEQKVRLKTVGSYPFFDKINEVVFFMRRYANEIPPEVWEIKLKEMNVQKLLSLEGQHDPIDLPTFEIDENLRVIKISYWDHSLDKEIKTEAKY
jgi:hypothetical protein